MKRILFIILLFMAISVGVILLLNVRMEKEQEIEQQMKLQEYYRQQNKVLPRVSGSMDEEFAYRGYETIDEPELYVYLAAYNEFINEQELDEIELTTEDIKEYLFSEFNEDESLRIYNSVEDIRYENYPHIYSYVEWYHECDGDEDIEEYWGCLEDIIIEYKGQNPELELCNAKEMSVAQLQELINKKNNPSYEINSEIMKGTE